MRPTRINQKGASLFAVQCFGRLHPPYAPLVVRDVGLFWLSLHSLYRRSLANDGGELSPERNDECLRAGLTRIDEAHLRRTEKLSFDPCQLLRSSTNSAFRSRDR